MTLFRPGRWPQRAACILVFTVLTAAAQILQPALSSRHYDFDISSLNGVAVHGEARGTDALRYSPSVSVTVAGDRATMHRLFLDETHRLYFGYDLLAVRVPGTNRVRLHFYHLSNLESFHGVSVGTLAPGGFVLPFTEREATLGQPLVLPLEVNRSGATVLQDKLTFGSPLR